MTNADWYFDFISPFAYLQSAKLEKLSRHATITPRPVLFAALLDHYGQLGPAEIAPKRTFTFRHALWLARRHGIPMKLPPSHPFNPLPSLRLAIALGNRVEVVQAIFDFIWREGRDISNPGEWTTLAYRLDAGDTDALVADPAVKDALRRSGEEAISRGVFGVPTLAVGDQLFWGFDSTEFFLDYLRHPDALRGEVFGPAQNLAQGPNRRRRIDKPDQR
jgi:2-hydroxychromene-2-carboxylate isomerase